MPLIWRVLDRQPVGSLSEYIDTGGGIASRAARRAPATEIIEVLSASGLRGRGGAGFPTGTKWATVAASRGSGEPTTVVVNAAEGEPGTFKDRALLRTNPYRVLEGAIVAAVTLQTDQVRIGIKGTFGREIERLTAAMAEMREAGWFHDVDVELVLGPSSYLFGEETALLEVVEGRQPFPRVTPPYRRGLKDHDTRSAVGVPLAAIGGSGGAPALVDNVETLANVPLIVDRGPDWFREVGTERSPGTIVCTVSGATRRSGVGEVAMGSTLREAIDAIGWGPQPGHEVQVVLAGTANPLIPSPLLDTPLTYEAMSEAGSGLGSAGFIVFDDTTEPAAIAAGVARFLAVESCGQCEPCKTDGLFIAEQLRRSLRGASTATDLSALRHRIETVTIGARCNLAQQQASVVASLLDLFPQSLSPRRHAASSRASDPVTIAPIADLVGGRAVLDPRQLDKQPDWSYDDTDSGAAPAARLGDTPVHITRPVRLRQWPEWSADVTTDHPLELVDEAHEAIDTLIDVALSGGEQDIERRADDVVVAVRTHIDVTQRVLYPMVRRIGDEEGELLADAAEAQEQGLSRLVGHIDPPDHRKTLQDIGVEMQAHAHLDDRILELLRAHLDPIERSSLADGLAAARATSTASRLRRTASRLPTSTRTRSLPQRLGSAPRAPGRPPADGPRPGSRPAGVAPPSERVATADVARPAGSPGSPGSPGSTAPGPDLDQTASIDTMLVGVDGSAAAAAALGWAGRLAGRVGAEVVVGNVFETDQAEVSPDDYEKLIAEAEHRLTTEWSKPLLGRGVRHRALQLIGGPDRLLDATDAEGIDLLVVGTRGAGRFAGLHIGSLAHHLAHHTRGPLAIVPAAGATATIDRMVVGVDGSAGSAAAVDWCARIAAAGNAEVIAVCAFERHPRWGSRTDVESTRAVAEAAISREWIAPLLAAGVTVRSRIIEGDHPAAALVAAAKDEDAGTLVVGTRSLSRVVDLRLSRLPLQLVHHTHLPVILIPPVEPN